VVGTEPIVYIVINLEKVPLRALYLHKFCYLEIHGLTRESIFASKSLAPVNRGIKNRSRVIYLRTSYHLLNRNAILLCW
jgi:hypothetical protein